MLNLWLTVRTAGIPYSRQTEARESVTTLVTMFCCLLFSGCAVVGERYQHIADAKPRAIILVHGFYGANLNRAADGERIWLSAKQVFWHSNTLAIDDGSLAIDGAQKLTEDGILRTVNVLPLIYKEDAYGEALDYLKKEFGLNHQIIPFAYDWRQDSILAVQALDKLVDQLEQEGKQKIIVIGHSMGGTILAYYLRYGAQAAENARESWAGANKIDLAIVLGAPFRGTIHVLKNMQEGIKLFWNSSLLKPEAYASFPSAYQMLPKTLELMGPKAENLSSPSADLGTWQKRKWGLLANSSVDPAAAERRVAYTEAQLSKASVFRSRLEAEQSSPKEEERQRVLPSRAKAPSSRLLSHPRARLVNFYGTGRPTLHKAVLVSDGDHDPGVLFFTEANLKEHAPGLAIERLMTDGDETVTTASARLPDAYRRYLPATEIETKAKHSALLGDVSVREAIELRIHAL